MQTNPTSREAYVASQNYLVAKWANALALKTGRPVEEILETGLNASDFGFNRVFVKFEDGSKSSFRYAFFVRDPAMPEWAGVFTEHSGYYEFFVTADDAVYEVRMRR